MVLKKDIQSRLSKNLIYPCDIFLFNEIDSTNTFLKEFLKVNDSKNILVIAKKQTSGKGQYGKSFFSPENGLYFSISLNPISNICNLNLITMAAAVAVIEAIKKTANLQCEIKWVNDIIYKNKKIAGILTETTITGNSITGIILGFGINISPPKTDFPMEFTKRVGTLFNECVDSSLYIELITEILNSFWGYYSNLNKKEYMPKYKLHSIIMNKTISFSKNGTLHIGKVISIDDNGQLVVLKNQGTETLACGSASIINY